MNLYKYPVVLFSLHDVNTLYVFLFKCLFSAEFLFTDKLTTIVFEYAVYTISDEAIKTI